MNNELAAIILIIVAVMLLVLYAESDSTERQLIRAAEQCWDAGERAVYIREDNEYVIRCRP